MNRFLKRAENLLSLKSELEGLKIIQKNLDENDINEIRTPQIIDLRDNVLILEKISHSSWTSAQMSQLGIGLARLHLLKQERYGWLNDNFIGLNKQLNTWSYDWGKFFCDYRLRPQIAMIRDPKLREQFSSILDQSSLAVYLSENCEFPSLVHGDLWNGNVIFSDNNVYLIDPAVYFGDREVDLAMSEMFGGFSNDFYEAYGRKAGLSAEYPKKKIIYNLYHYLNHYNLFGSGYLVGCKQAFDLIKNFFI